MLSPFTRRDHELMCDDVPLREIAAACGTPVYVYSARGIVARYAQYDDAFGAFPHRICFAVKANANLAILRLLAGAGAGFDIVSGGELFRALQAGADPRSIVFSGVGKTVAEMEYALAEGIDIFNCESEPELRQLSAVAARRNVTARVAIRVNPDVDAATHPYISTGLRDHKFGVPMEEAELLYTWAADLPGILPVSVSCHIGSQLLANSPLLEAIQRVRTLALRLRDRGLPITQLDLGGGLGVAYEPQHDTPSIVDYVHDALRLVAADGFTVVMEPGRSIVAECGALVTAVLYRKRGQTKDFVIVDAAMNDLLRPALYKAHHEIVPVTQRLQGMVRADVVGPVCETGDFFARDRDLPILESGELVAILTAGAYGFALSSNYNSRPRSAEVLVEGDRFRVVRRRETPADLVRGEE